MNDKVAVMDKLMGDQKHQKRGVAGLKFKNQEMALRTMKN